MTPDEERIERLERALLELVYWGPNFEDDRDADKVWRADHRVDVDVNHIIGDLLDKYKPQDPSL